MTFIAIVVPLIDSRARLVAALVAGAVAAIWKNTLLTIASGFAAFWLLSWILS